MNKERWQKVEEIFNAVVDISREEREPFLRRYCGEDSELREHVERLLSADEQADDFIESPVPMSHITRLFDTTVIELQGEALVGRMIGAYKLLGEIGRGGMGAVFLAERADSEFYQRVAIKLIKRGMDTDFILKRFRNERQILANLNHPNIARLLDGGTTDDGLPYFVMEFIEGKPITKYCDARRLSIDERLLLFRQVCAAVQYAHQNLVIHRDIKPGNILVTESGVLKLLDFGIAKILNPEFAHDTIEPTATAIRLMTPEYASPEQVRGERITPASDQYSLGVLLYELITGHRPYSLKNHLPHEIARVICEEDPERPSTAISRIEEIVGADKQPQFLTPEVISRNRNTTPDTLRRVISKGLDDIVMQALHKDPNKRYSSVEELSEDIWRYLSGESIHAAHYTPTVIESRNYKSDNESQPNSIAILPLKVLKLTSTDDTDSGDFLGAGIADALITRLSNIKSLTVRPTASVMKFGSEDSDALNAGRELRVNYVLDGRLVQVGERIRVTVQLINVKTQSPQWAAQFDERMTDLLSLQDELSEQVAQEIIQNLSGEELRQLSKRGTENHEAYEKYLRGRYYWNIYTEDGLAKAIRYFYEAIALDPNFAAAYSGVADYHTWLGMISILPPSECFLAAKEAAATALGIDNKLAEAHASLAFTTWAYDWDNARSEKLYKRALRLNKNYAQAHEWYSHLLGSQGRFDEAVREMKHALDIDPQSAQLHLMMGSMLHNARRFEEGARYIERAAELAPDNYLVLQAFGWLYPRIGKAEKALEHCRKALEISKDSPVAMLTLIHVLLQLDKRDEAMELLNQLHKLEEKRFVSLCYFATAYAELGDKDKAFEYLNKMIDEREYWAQWLRVAPRFDPLREDRRFTEILKRVTPLEKDTGEFRAKKTGIHEGQIDTNGERKAETKKGVAQVFDSDKEEKKQTHIPFYRRLSFAHWAVIALCCVALIFIGWFVVSKFMKDTPNTKVRRLTNNLANDTYPKVSPDGTKVLFISTRDGNSEVYVMNIDGSNVKRLTYNSTFEGNASWFPDGRILVESIAVTGSKNDFWIMNADGSNQTKITNSDMNTSRPTVSPDGKKIAFASDKDGKGRYDFNIWVMDADGSNLQKITDYDEFDSDPAWSPDGKQIAFTRATQRGAFDIMIMNADGTNQRNITNTPEVQEVIPAWSPDGKQIAFCRSLYDTSNNMEIWLMNADGSNKRQITNNPMQDSEPSWLPDGKQLVFQTNRDGNNEIYLINTDNPEATASSSSSSSSSERKTIAVLPFKTNGGDEEDKSLSMGFSESLATKLSQLKQLSVRRVIVLDEAALKKEKDLGIEYVVSGASQRINDRVQISVKLTQVSDGKILWAEKFDQPFMDIANLQNTIAERILKTLTIQLTDKESQRLNKRYTEDNEVYQLYLVGRYHLGRRSSDGLKEAIKNFDKAIARDNKFAPAYAGLSDCYALIALYGSQPPSVAYPRAKEFALKAIELDDSLAEAHASLAYVKFYYDFERAEALKEFERAVELNPSYATGHHWFGLALSAMGRHAEAQEQMKLAQEIEPRSAIIKAASATVLYYAKRYDDALLLAEEAIELDTGLVPAHRVMRWIYQTKGNGDKANAAYQKEKSFSGDGGIDWPVIVAQIQAFSGKFEEAKINIQRGIDSAPVKRDPAYLAYDIAIAYGLLNERDKAFFWLEKSQTLKSHSINYALVDPRLDILRDDPRFAEILRKAKLSD